VKPSSSTLKRAAQIEARIKQLESQLEKLLKEGRGIDARRRPGAVIGRATVQSRGLKPLEKAGRRSKASSGPLAPAVVKVLQSAKAPMSVGEILDGLRLNGYKFGSSEPKKNLFARIYRLKGVKKVGPGKFTAQLSA
jgi:hypothetical protein